MKNKLTSPIEYEFRLKYGCYPFEYTQRQIENGLTRDEASAKLQSNMDKVWRDMRYAHERKKNLAKEGI